MLISVGVHGGLDTTSNTWQCSPRVGSVCCLWRTPCKASYWLRRWPQASRRCTVRDCDPNGTSNTVWAVCCCLFTALAPVCCDIYNKQTNKQTAPIPKNERALRMSKSIGKVLERNSHVWPLSRLHRDTIWQCSALFNDALNCQGTYRRWHNNQYGATVQSYWQGTQKCSHRNLSCCHFVHHKSHLQLGWRPTASALPRLSISYGGHSTAVRGSNLQTKTALLLTHCSVSISQYP